MLEEGKYYWVRVTPKSQFEICRYNDRMFYSTRGYEYYASACADCLYPAIVMK
jgi:hypothetical protein